MLVLLRPRVASRAPGFPVASPCVWGKLQIFSFSKVFKQVVMSFCVAGVALCDIPTCLIMCRKCQNWRKSRTKCSFWCSHVSCLESLVFLWPRRVYGGRRKTFPFRRFSIRLSCRATFWRSLSSFLHGRRSTSDVSHCLLYAPHSKLHTPHSTLCTSRSALYTPHSTLYTLHSTLYTLPTAHSTLRTLHPTLRTPHTTLNTPHSTLSTPHSALYTLHSTLYTTFFTPHSSLHTLQFTLHTPHSPLYTPHSTLYTLHFTLYTLHCTLLTPRSTLLTPHSTLHTPHSTLHTLHTLHSTLHTLHSTLYTLYTPHSTLSIPHSLLYTPHSTLYTFHSALQTGNKGNMYKTVQINYCRKVFCVTAYPRVLTSVPLTYVWACGFVGCILLNLHIRLHTMVTLISLQLWSEPWYWPSITIESGCNSRSFVSGSLLRLFGRRRRGSESRGMWGMNSGKYGNVSHDLWNH